MTNKKVVNRKYRLKSMGASVASDSGIGPDRLLLFNFLEERDKRQIKKRSRDSINLQIYR
jgi:hypothetical protein